LRFVLDTSVIVSAALIEASTSRRAFDHALDTGKILLSAPVLEELNEVLGREKFRGYIHEDEAKLFLALFVRSAEWVEVNVRIAACRDPSDNKFLELAVSGRATHIISGDSDLLSMNPFHGVAVVTPDAFLQELR
jgi:putative PIN family toxin of toxin-antitoxin system